MNSDCGTQSQTLASSESKTYTSGTIPNGNGCWYEIKVASSGVSMVNIDITSMNGGTTEVYYGTASGTYAYIGEKSATGAFNQTVAASSTVYLLFGPDSATGTISFTAKDAFYTASSSDDDDDDDWIYMAIFIPIGGVCLI